MPLLDHFHPPLIKQRDWGAFHAAWSGCIRDDLNERLPERYFAEALTHAGASIEIDVATLEKEPVTTSVQSRSSEGEDGGIASFLPRLRRLRNRT